MSNKIGVIAEDDSDVDVIKEIFKKYMADKDFSIKKFIGRGSGKLRCKCDSWASLLVKQGCKHIFIFHDLDRYVEGELREILLKKIDKKIFPNSLIVIPVEELEAWLLSDMAAISSVFNFTRNPKRVSNCETIKSPKEHLERLIYNTNKVRYLNTIHNKKIAELIGVENLRKCKSFLPLDSYIRLNIL